MTVLEEAKQHLATYGAAHVECCGTPMVRKLVKVLEEALASLEAAADDKFEYGQHRYSEGYEAGNEAGQKALVQFEYFPGLKGVRPRPRVIMAEAQLRS